MRKQFNYGTYTKVSKHFIENPSEEYSATKLRDLLDIDYYSIKLILKTLLEEREIQEKNNKYKIRGWDMVNMKETIKVEQVHDNDKYIINRRTYEELNGVELVKIHTDMVEALNNVITQLKDMPKQYEARMKVLETEKKMITDRLGAFVVHVKRIKDLSKEEEKPKVEEKQ